MATSVKAIATVEVGAGGAASIEFTNIPAIYTDLQILYSLRASGSYTGTSSYFTVNSNTSNRSFKFVAGNSASTESYGSTGNLWAGYENGSTSTSSTFSSNFIYIPNYAGSTNKSISSDGTYENNSSSNGTASVGMGASLWADTTAISSVQISPYSGTWAQYSTATLYGIKG